MQKVDSIKSEQLTRPFEVLVIIVINCTQPDLESIAANNPDIELVGAIDELYYGTRYYYKCKEFGKNFQKNDGTFQSYFTVSCESTKSWTSVNLPCQCKN